MDSEHVSLREFVERILTEREKALNLSTTTLEKRLEMLNELRGDVLTRTEYRTAHENLVDRLARLENWQAKIVGGGILLMFLSGFLGAAITYFTTKH